MTTLADELDDLVEGVLALLETARSDPDAIALELELADLCVRALESSGPPAPDPTTRAESGNRNARIAALAAAGQGVRAIARALGVAPSTVSRRMRRAAVQKT